MTKPGSTKGVQRSSHGSPSLTTMARSRFRTACSTRGEPGSAFAEALEGLTAAMAGETPDFVAAFATHHYGTALEELGPRVQRATGCRNVMGCTAESVIGGDREIEDGPGLVLFGANVPGVAVRPFHVKARPVGGASEDETEFDALPPVGGSATSRVLLVADPFSFPADDFLKKVNEELPGVPVIGGMASGAMGPGQSLLFTSDGFREAGAVGFVLDGAMEFRTVVSQGCRPVGKPMVITACEQNVILKLGGQPALETLIQTWNTLPSKDQVLMQNAPFIGLAIDPTKSQFQRGDFLVRAILGFDQKHQLIALGELVRRGQTVQFLVRDAESAGEDLRFLLATQGGVERPTGGEHAGGGERPTGGEHQGSGAPEHEVGALIFSCNGRGSRMFQEANHDVSCVRSQLSGKVTTAGFFAAGEIGPVGGRNYVHGFTASVAVLHG